VFSKDAGFDPLIGYLRKKNIHCKRVSSANEILAPEKTAARSFDDTVSIEERVEKVKENLLKRPAGRPRTSKTLRSTTNALFQKKLSAKELDELVAALANCKFIAEKDGKVSYMTA
jgi:hypothetical protein